VPDLPSREPPEPLVDGPSDGSELGSPFTPAETLKVIGPQGALRIKGAGSDDSPGVDGLYVAPPGPH